MSPEMQAAKLMETLTNLRPACRPQRYPSYPYTPLHGIFPPRHDPLWLVPLLVPISNIRYIEAQSTTMPLVIVATTAIAGGFPPLPADMTRTSWDTLQAILFHNPNSLRPKTARLMDFFLGSWATGQSILMMQG